VWSLRFGERSIGKQKHVAINLNFDSARASARSRYQDRNVVMNLLLLLAVPSLTALSCMITGITLDTVYPRLQRRHHLVGQLIVFPRR
jgi:hypothetical protein